MADKKGLRLETRGEGNYYKVILHVGSILIPISDDIVEELRNKTDQSPDLFFKTFVDKVGYSSYLTGQIRQTVLESGDLAGQMTAIQEFLKQIPA